MKTRIAAWTVSLLVLGSVAFAGTQVSLDAADMPIDRAAKELGSQAGVQIICDKDVKGSVTGHFVGMELDKVMDSITAGNKLVWRKLYMPAPADGEKSPTVEQMKSRIDALLGITVGTVALYDPATGKQRVFVEEAVAAPKVEPDKLGLKPAYIISMPKTDQADSKQTNSEVAKQFQTLAAERNKLLAQMSPEQRVASLQQEMYSMLQMDPSTRNQLLADQWKARQNMPQDMQDAYRQMMRDAMRANGGGPGGGGWGGGRRRGGGGGNGGG